jgi:hypothetical protein
LRQSSAALSTRPAPPIRNQRLRCPPSRPLRLLSWSKRCNTEATHLHATNLHTKSLDLLTYLLCLQVLDTRPVSAGSAAQVGAWKSLMAGALNGCYPQPSLTPCFLMCGGVEREGETKREGERGRDCVPPTPLLPGILKGSFSKVPVGGVSRGAGSRGAGSPMVRPCLAKIHACVWGR